MKTARLILLCVVWLIPILASPGATNVAFAPLGINEVQAANVSVVHDNNGDYDPWIELNNAGGIPILLDGLYLSNNYTNLTKWAFPPGFIMSPGERRIVFCDGQPAQSTGGEFHTSFALASSGSVILSKQGSNSVQVIDSVDYPSLPANYSFGSFPDGQSTARREFYFATPGQANVGAAPPPNVLINEWMASNLTTLDPADGNADDWFELYNPTATPADLAGYYLTDTIVNPFKYQIPPGYVIAPHGYLMVWADVSPNQNSNDRIDLHVNFSLATGGEAIGLFAPDGTQIDAITFGIQSNNVSEGRCPDGGTNIVRMSFPTPRLANSGCPTNRAPTLAPIGDKFVYLGQTLSFTATATDADTPSQTLSYTLDDTPTVAAVDSVSGAFTWTPGAANLGTNTLTLRVTDTGTPPRQDFETIAVYVFLPPGQSAPTATLPDLRLSKAGVVNALAVQADGRILIGGSFTSVNDVPLRNLARLSAGGSVDSAWAPNPDGPVLALATSGSNVYVGGNFSSIGGQFRNSLALLRTGGAGQADPDWAPLPGSFSGLPTISTLVVSASNLWVGGLFDSIGGQTNLINLAKLSADGNGAPDPAWAPRPNAAVNTLVLSGTNLYVGGQFTALGNNSRNRLVRLLAASGAIDFPWNPDVDSFNAYPSSTSSIDNLLLNGTNVLLGGAFSQIGASSRIGLARVSTLSTGAVDAVWNPSLGSNGTASALAIVGSSLFVGGEFDQVGGRALRNLARVSLGGSGNADTNWTPRLNAPIRSLLANGTWLFAGGEFALVNDTISLGIAKLDQASAVVDERFAAQVGAPGEVHAIVRQSNGKIIVGGDFWFAGQTPRANLVRLSADGALDSFWAPGADAPVNALALSGTNLYVGGLFRSIKAQSRNGLAKVDTTGTDLVDASWNPATGPSANVYALAADSTNLYVGGINLGLNGLGSLSFARLNLGGSGTADANWNSVADGPVRAIAISLTNVFVGGEFTTIAGSSRNGLAKFPTTSKGIVESNWVVTAFGSAVHALAADNAQVFVGGSFTNINGLTRRGVAKVSAFGAGALDVAWAPSLSPPVLDVYALALDGGNLYVEGNFSGSQATLARIFSNGSVDLAWNPGLFGSSSSGPLLGAVLPVAQDFYVGGPFQSVSGAFPGSPQLPRNGLAFLAPSGAPVIARSTGTNFVILPNPYDGPEITHFRILAISGGTLFLKGTTNALGVGDFITVAQGANGLFFVGTNVTVTVAAALNATASGVGVASSTFTMSAPITPVFSLGKPAYSVNESVGSLLIPVRKIGGTGSVSYVISDGTAINGIDYVGASGVLTFSAGQTNMNVSIAILDNSFQNLDRSFSIRLTNASGGGLIASPAAATITIADDDYSFATGSFLTNRLPAPLPAANSALSLNLQPPAANGRWRIAGQSAWQTNGAVVSNLVAGTYRIEFMPVPGYREPDSVLAQLAGGTLVLSNAYIPSLFESGSGYISLLIAPDDLATNPVVAARGQWRPAGTVAWLNSGDSYTNLSPGPYDVEFKSVANYVSPPGDTLMVFADEGARITGYYCRQTEALGSPPSVVSFNQATNRPFVYAGQMRTELGFGSGVVVLDRVVLTAAHLLFDDANLGYVSEANWFARRYAGRYEPAAQTPRGMQLLAGYAAQRELERPGTRSLTSLDQDVAALYLFESAGAGGFSGYLAASGTNRWLTTGRQKTLMGYPMDGVSISNQGMVFATSPSNINFVQVSSNLFTTSEVRGYPGLSGGPVLVRYDDGNDYPAGIYLGPCLASNLVRELDAGVAELISRADLSATARYAISLPKEIISDTTNVFRGTGPSSGIAYLEIHTGPAAALATGAGGGWLMPPDPRLHTGLTDSMAVSGQNSVSVEFRCVANYGLPARTSDLKLSSGATYIINAPYLAQPRLPSLLVNTHVFTETIQNVTKHTLIVDGVTLSNGVAGYSYRIDQRVTMRAATAAASANANTAGPVDWAPMETVRVLNNGPVFVPEHAFQPAGPNRFYRVLWLNCTN